MNEGADNPGMGSSEQTSESRPSVKSFSCTNCGASVSMRYPGASLSVVCDSCHSVIDATDELYRIVQEHDRATRHWTPRIKLGDRGVLFGKEWEVIGFLVRTDAASSYSWEEYLLYSPYYGYRWLTLNDLHWSFVSTTKEKPLKLVKEARLGKKNYKIFYTGQVFISYVIGEFYWKVKVGENVSMADYICPPEMLSSEEDGSQRIWAISEYLYPEVVYQAFDVDNKPELRFQHLFRPAPNQPSKYGEIWLQMRPLFLIFLVTIFGIQYWRSSTCLNRVEYTNNFRYFTNARSKRSVTSDRFELTKPMSNVVIRISADVDNAWLYVIGQMVHEASGTTFWFERTIEYYHGVDYYGDYWSEGGHTKEISVSNVPGGVYHLNFDTEHNDYPKGLSHKPRRFNVVIKRDIEQFGNIFWALLLISIWPGFVWLRAHSFEVARWSQSDYSPYPQHQESYYDEY